MLKLTNSFYRYFWFTCDKGDKIHVRRFAHLNCKEKTCVARCAESIYIARLRSNVLLHKKLAQGKKRLKIHIPSLNLGDSKGNTMSDRLPIANIASSRGNLTGFEEWQREAFLSTTIDQNWLTNFNQQSRSIPPAMRPPNFRIWETAGLNNTVTHGTTLKFRVLSYNVLAQYLLECHPYLYTECSSQDLKWDIRALRLYQEILSYAPDVLCLQEVQATHLPSFYSKFEKIGYFGVYKQKTGKRQDGCAIYFKKSVFDLKDHITVEFHQPELAILNRDNIGMMVKLVPRNYPASPVVIATTHLLYNPKRTDVRLAQMQVFLAEIDRFAYFSNGKESGHLPIILTGDFNSTPDSAVIQLLDRGHVRVSPFRDSTDWKRIGITNNCQHLSVLINRREGRKTNFSDINIYNSDYCVNNAGTRIRQTPLDKFNELFNNGVVGHTLRLNSVYDKQKIEGDIEATTFQEYWLTVDYIYFSCCSSLNLVDRLRLPTPTECEALGGLPNGVFGSDHLALAATFELMPSYNCSL